MDADRIGGREVGQLQPFVPGAASLSGRVLWSVAAAGLLVIPVGLAVGPGGLSPRGVALALGVTLAATGIYLLGRRLPAWPREAPWNVRLQAISTAVAAVMAVPLQLAWLGVLG